MTIDITIPVLNEEETLVKQVEKTLQFLMSSSLQNYRIVIADNGSDDQTEFLGRQLASIHEGKVSFIKVGKRGVGLALRTSWMQSDADIVGYMDLDLATDLKHLEQVYHLIKNEGIPVVNGSRLLAGSHVVNRTLTREFTSRTFNSVVRNLLGVSFTDGMCGFKFFRRQIAQSIIATGVNTEGWIFSTEMLVKTEWKGIYIHEIPVHWEDDQNSKVKIFKLSLEYLRHLWKLRKEKKYWMETYAT